MFNQTFKDKALRSKPIVITATGIKKTISQKHNNPEMKIKILKDILEQITKAKYVKTSESYKDEHKGLVKYHYLKVKLNEQTAYVNIVEVQNSDELTFYSITDRI